VLQAVRGASSTPTARAYYAGPLELHCKFDDFVVDTPLNRMINAAAREVSRSSLLTKAVRRDALKIVARWEDVGELRQSDHFVEVERPTWYYRDALALARHILRFVGRTIGPGDASAWTFLIRTPELVEAGIRQILRDALAPEAVKKKGKRLANSEMTVNPDIVFGDVRALADVKYKLMDGSWNRSDLYEAVAFAAAFRVQHTSLIGFSASSTNREDLGVGEFRVAKFAWPCSEAPQAAASHVSSSVKSWLGELQ
jgi:5-methylcytosine-specific restriction enzyme subunit McrC